MAADNKNRTSVSEMIEQQKRKRKFFNQLERMIPGLLLIIASISVLTTIGIIYTLFAESVAFFRNVPILDFFTGTVLKPLSQNPEFGVLPLLNGTIISTVIAMLVAG